MVDQIFNWRKNEWLDIHSFQIWNQEVVKIPNLQSKNSNDKKISDLVSLSIRHFSTSHEKYIFKFKLYNYIKYKFWVWVLVGLIIHWRKNGRLGIHSFQIWILEIVMISNLQKTNSGDRKIPSWTPWAVKNLPLASTIGAQLRCLISKLDCWKKIQI